MTLEEEVIQAETRRYAAIVAADADALRECISPRLVYVHSTALIEDRQTYIEKLTSGQRKYLSFEPGGRTLTDLGNAICCVGPLKVRAQVGDRAIDNELVFTTVYAREDGKLRMVGWHSCALKAA